MSPTLLIPVSSAGETLDVLLTFVDATDLVVPGGDDAEPLLPDIEPLDFPLETAYGSLGRNKKSIPECHMCPAGMGVGEGCVWGVCVFVNDMPS